MPNQMGPYGAGYYPEGSRSGSHPNIPKRLSAYAIKNKLTIGRRFDSRGKHVAYTLGSSYEPKTQQIVGTAGGLMNRMRSEVKRRKESGGGGDVHVRSYTRSKPSR